MKFDISDPNPDAPSFDRREFIVGSIFAAGTFAAAVQPIVAQTRIITDSVGLTAGEVMIPVKDGKMPAYRAMPEKRDGRLPVVIVIHEIFGVHEWIQDICRRLAKEGFMAIAPALHFRQGDPANITDFRELQAQIFTKMSDAAVMEDLDSTMDWAESTDGDRSRAAVTGFCWGGRIVWLYAAHNPAIKAGIAWYGRVVNNPGAPVNPVQPKSATDVANDIKVPVLGIYGGKDGGIPVDTVEALREKLKKGSSGSDIVIYPDAGHGFLADYRQGYHRESSLDAWPRFLEWMRRNGVK
jgi:carboxymethylenebutenolidase